MCLSGTAGPTVTPSLELTIIFADSATDRVFLRDVQHIDDTHPASWNDPTLSGCIQQRALHHRRVFLSCCSFRIIFLLLLAGVSHSLCVFLFCDSFGIIRFLFLIFRACLWLKIFFFLLDLICSLTGS